MLCWPARTDKDPRLPAEDVTKRGRSSDGREWELESLPPPLHLHPPLRCPLLRIRAQGVFPPPIPLQPPGQCSSSIPFAFVPRAVRRRATHVNPPCSNCWMTSRRGCFLWRSLWATPYPQLGWGTGQLPMNTGSGASVLFLRRIILSTTRPEDQMSGGGSRDQLHDQI
jgi:hypothetical protein